MKSKTISFRLRKHADYQRVYKQTHKQFARQISYFFWYRPTSIDSTVHNPPPASEISLIDLGPSPRIGLTVGKVLGNAVHRNRIKRRMRAAIRKNIALLDQCTADVVLHPRRSVLDLQFAVLDQEIASIFRVVARSRDKAQRQRRRPLLHVGQ